MLLKQRPSTSVSSDTFDLWHQRLGHPALGAMNTIQKRFDLKFVESESVFDCSDCNLGKAVTKKPKTSTFVASKPLELLHVDVCGPFRYTGLTGERYFVTMVDSFSNYVDVKVITSKDQAYKLFDTVTQNAFISSNVKFCEDTTYFGKSTDTKDATVTSYDGFGGSPGGIIGSSGSGIVGGISAVTAERPSLDDDSEL
jgi:hypothetical protein